MPSSPVKSVILPALLLIIGFTLITVLSAKIEAARPHLPEGYEDRDLSVRGSRMKGFLLGMDGLVADWYYTRALQYIGGKMVASPELNIDLGDLTPLNPRLLYPLLENSTKLDEHFIEAYSYGAIVLPGIDPEQAIALASAGIQHNPDSWRLYQQLGYTYWRLKRYEEAAETYEKGSRIAGAPPFMALMAASVKTESGSRENARKIYQQMLDTSDDPMVRLTAERRLNELDSLDEREAIDSVLASYRESAGRCPASLIEILPALRSVKLPGGRQFRVDRSNRLVDPAGVPYLLDAAECKSKIDLGHTSLLN